MSLQNRSIHFRVFLSIAFVAVLQVVCFVIVLITLENNRLDETVGGLRAHAEKVSRDRIKGNVEMITQLVGELEREVEIGNLSYEEATQQAVNLITPLRFGEQDRFFAIDFSAKEEGKVLSLWGVLDFGVNLAEEWNQPHHQERTEAIYQLASNGGGFLEYEFQEAQKDVARIRQKVSYVSPLNRWGWAIGGGYYVPDVQQQIDAYSANAQAAKGRSIKIGLVFLFTFFMLSFGIAWATTRKYLQNMAKMANYFDSVSDPNDSGIFEDFTTAEFKKVASSAEAMLLRIQDAEKKSKDSQDRLTSVLASLRDYIFALDQDGKIEFVNPAVPRDFGGQIEDWVGNSFSDKLAFARLGQSERKPWKEMHHELMLTSSGFDVVLEKPKSHHVFHMHCAPWRQGFGSGNLIILRNVTLERQLAMDLLHAQKMEGVGRLAGGIAHDFNNVLTIILGYADLLKNLQLGPNVDPIVQGILDSGEKAASLTKKFLGFSRKQIRRPTVFDLNQHLSSLEEMLEKLLPENIKLEISNSDSAATIYMDQTQLEQVLVNLVVNARDAIRFEGKIQITLTVEGEQVLLRVIDSGSGIPAEIRHVIFEPFFTTKEQGKGTGLGLSTVKEILSQSKAEIDIEHSNDSGTVVLIKLPLSTKTKDEPAQTPHVLSRDGKETILVVEDEEDLLDLVVQGLNYYGYNVLAAHDSLSLQNILATGKHIDVMVSDLIMPDISGLEAAKMVSEFFPECKLFFMSGYPGEHVKTMDNWGYGDAAFIQKPFKVEGLIRLIRQKK